MYQKFEAYTCWQPERVGQVINPEAVEMDSATFLATHTPISGLRYESGEYEVIDKTEVGLLYELINRSERDRHTFVVLKGIPGTGKSHLIRWLKENFESYSRSTDNGEVVMLIRRVNSSLRETLKQIIESPVFDSPLFTSYVERLQAATVKLSDLELSNSILNGLQEAALAVREGTYPPPSDLQFSKRIVKNAPDFLTDNSVRNFLMRSDGAVERIAQFLSGENRTTGEGMEMPRFTEEDFVFPLDTVKAISNLPDSYTGVKNLFEFSKTQSSQVAAYFNSLLNYAVSNLTSLTIDQLKGMFATLRRHLRRQGKSLTLFVEDITALTGLDIGLIDMLIAQQGANNPEFCRLTSLIGITDSYYDQNFRDNVRQRVTFLISLNTKYNNETVSNLLQSTELVTSMAARYLNVIRHSQETVMQWYGHHSASEALRSYCLDCPFMQPCHASFGFVQISDDNPVGLYPFNGNALTTAYNQIDTQKTTRTPRALLRSILSHILTSHWSKIRNRQFPPSTRDLAPDVIPPILKKPAQRQIIDANASGHSAERYETLIRYWGDGTIDTYEIDGQIFVGELPQGVFQAFSLPFFRGDEVSVPAPTQIIDAPPRHELVISPNAEDIENWRMGGKLESYRLLADDLAKFVKAAVEWDLYGISRSLVDERMRQAQFEIEGQTGRLQATPRYLFRRSDDHALVLHTVDEIRHVKYLTPDQIATCSAILHSWLEQNLTSLLHFVQGIGVDDGKAPLDYHASALQATFGLAVLAGALVQSQTTNRELFLRLVDFAKGNNSIQTLENRTEKRSAEWRDLISSLTSAERDGDAIRKEFLIMLNCPQGTSVIYVDAARALRLISEFKQQRLQIPIIEYPNTKSSAWLLVSNVHYRLAHYLPAIYTAEVKSFEALRDSILSYLDTDTPIAVFDAIDEFMKFASEVRFELRIERGDLTGLKLERRLADLAKIPQSEDDMMQFTLWLSGALNLKSDLVKYKDYFQQLSEHLVKNTTAITEGLKSKQSADVAVQRQVIQETLTKFADLAGGLLKED